MGPGGEGWGPGDPQDKISQSVSQKKVAVPPRAHHLKRSGSTITSMHSSLTMLLQTFTSLQETADQELLGAPSLDLFLVILGLVSL